jgi:hypothetical protein
MKLRKACIRIGSRTLKKVSVVLEMPKSPTKYAWMAGVVAIVVIASIMVIARTVLSSKEGFESSERGRHVIVLMSDAKYASKTIDTIRQIRSNGKYTGDIVLLTEESNVSLFQKESGDLLFIIKPFDMIDVSHILEKIKKRPFTNSDQRELNKTFQWFKIHVFDTYFKQWDNVLYVDAGMHIYKDMSLFFEMIRKYKQKSATPAFIAHSDAYPKYEWKLYSQFDKYSYPNVYSALEKHIKLDTDYFQTGMMLFDTALIRESTKQELIDLMNKYYISKTNEQGIMNIYFNGIHSFWKPMPVQYKNTWTYDYTNRDGKSPTDYCMIKYVNAL